MKPLDYAAPESRPKGSNIWIPLVVIFAMPAWIAGTILIRGTIHSYQGCQRAALAGAHAPTIRSRLAGDGRFRFVSVGFPNGGDPSVITGIVQNKSDLDALHRIVQSTSPPVEIDWRVVVAAWSSSKSTTVPS